MSTEEGNERTYVPSGIDRDLENARVLLEDPPWCDSPEKYRKTAEAIIQRILAFDPGNERAKELLEKARIPVVVASPPPPPQPPAPEPRAPEPPALEAAAPPQEPHVRLELEVAAPAPPPMPSPRPVQRIHEEELAFVAKPPRRKPEVRQQKSSAAGLAGIAAILAIVGLIGFLVLSSKSKTDYPLRAAAAAPAPEPVSVPAAEPELQPQSQPQPQPQVSNPVESAAPAPVPEVAAKPAVATPVAETVVVKSAAPVVAPIQTGTLAISSPTTVDIYLGDQLVGSAPTTLELPAGTQRLEYRHQDMRKVVMHVIKPSETTTAMITFDIPVQINAKPWAQVSIQGSQRQLLGQTPLSDIRVPIGSVLLFENPNFPPKTYRVNGRESEIRVNFP